MLYGEILKIKVVDYNTNCYSMHNMLVPKYVREVLGSVTINKITMRSLLYVMKCYDEAQTQDLAQA